MIGILIIIFLIRDFSAINEASVLLRYDSIDEAGVSYLMDSSEHLLILCQKR